MDIPEEEEEESDEEEDDDDPVTRLGCVVRGMRISILRTDTRARNWCMQNSVEFKVVKSRKDPLQNPHDLLAQIRKVKTAKAFLELYRKGCRDILSLWGSRRDVLVSDKMNAVLEDADRFRVMLHQAVHVPEDMARVEPHAVTEIDKDRYDGYFMCDVYQAGPLSVVEMFKQCAPHPVVWLGHEFCGAYGTIHEAVWIRKGPSVLFKTDASAAPRIHPHPHWTNPGQDGSTAWTTLSSAHGYCMVLACETRNMLSQYSVRPDVPNGERVLRFPRGLFRPVWTSCLALFATSPATRRMLSSIPRWICDLVTYEHRVLIDVRLYRKLQETIAARTPTAYSYRQCLHTAQLEVLQDPTATAVRTAFPEHYVPIAEATANAAFFDLIADRAEVLDYYATVTGGDASALVDANARIGKSPEMEWSTFIVPLMTFGLPTLIFLWNRSASPAGFKRYATISYTNMLDHPAIRKFPSIMCSVATSRFPSSWTTSFAKGFAALETFVRTSSYCLNLCGRVLLSLIQSTRNQVLAPVNRGLIPTLAFGIYASMPLVSPAYLLVHPLTMGWVYHVYPTAVLLILGPVLEEVVKRCSYGAALPALELLMRPPEAFDSSIATMLCHYAWRSCSLPWGVFLHVTHNLGVYVMSKGVEILKQSQVPLVPTTSATVSSAPDLGAWWFPWAAAIFSCFIAVLQRKKQLKQWKRFVETYYHEPWPARALIELPIGVEPLAPQEAQVTKSSTSYSPIPEMDTAMELSSPLVLPLEEIPIASVYFAFAFSVPMYSPDGSDVNLYYAVLYRVLARPPMPPPEQEAAWGACRQDMLKRLDIDPMALIIPEQHREEWFARLVGIKARRMADAGQELANVPLDPQDLRTRALPVMVKTNEVLYRFAGEQLQLKPRLIINLPPLIQYELGPEIWVASKRLAALWDGTHPTTDGIYIIYGGMATKDLLDKTMLVAIFWDAVFLYVAGDDSFLIDHGRYAEADLKMCDQSISSGPLLTSYDIYHLLGVSRSTTRILWRTAHTPYRIVFRNGARVKIFRENRPIRDTGGPDTSLGNTIIVAAAWVQVLKTPWTTRDQLVERFATLGFDMKIRVFATPSEATFLKGTWLSDEAGNLRWSPLPSRVLKLTKSLKDFRALFPGTYEEAARKYLACQANMLASFPAVPLLRVLVERFYDGETRHTDVEKLRVEASGYDQRVVDWAPLCSRYDTTPEEFLEVESMLRTAPIPSFISHPLFERLARADYG